MIKKIEKYIEDSQNLIDEYSSMVERMMDKIQKFIEFISYVKSNYPEIYSEAITWTEFSEKCEHKWVYVEAEKDTNVHEYVYCEKCTKEGELYEPDLDLENKELNLIKKEYKS